MSNETDDALASLYELLWPAAELADSRFALFERDLGGRGVEDVLFDVASEAGIGRHSVVLDVGCGRGKQTCALAKNFACQVIAVDPLEHCLGLARERAEAERVGDLVDFRRGDMDRLPVGNHGVDLLWCVDAFNHARHPPAALREFARVLKPNGLVFNCSALESPSLEPLEKEWLCRTLSLNPATLSRATLEPLFVSSGLHVRTSGSTCEAGSTFFERIAKRDYRYVARLSHMARDERKLVDAFGETQYQLLKAHALWNVYLLIGKLTYHVWVMGLPHHVD